MCIPVPLSYQRTNINIQMKQNKNPVPSVMHSVNMHRICRLVISEKWSNWLKMILRIASIFLLILITGYKIYAPQMMENIWRVEKSNQSISIVILTLTQSLRAQWNSMGKSNKFNTKTLNEILKNQFPVLENIVQVIIFYPHDNFLHLFHFVKTEEEKKNT